jgi:hypothetical protein
MKQKLLLLAAVFAGTVFNSTAQTTVYSNDFTVGTGLTIIDADGDANNWGLYTGNATTAGWGLTGNFAGSRSWNPANTTTGAPATALTPNNFLLSPQITIPTSFGASTLSFSIGSNDASFPAEQISIYLAPITATTAAAISALTPVFNYTLTASEALIATTFTADVSAYAGQTVKIVMRHHGCTDQDLIFFDDLLLSQETLGNETFEAAQFVASPNPTSGVINVMNKNNTTIKNVVLTDLNGRIVREISNESMSFQMDLTDLSTGIYMMKIRTDKGVATKKIIKN